MPNPGVLFRFKNIEKLGDMQPLGRLLSDGAEKSADRIAGPCRFPGNLPPLTSDSGYVCSSLKFGQFPEFWHPVLSLVLDFQSIANGYEIADDCWWGGCVSAKSVVAPDEEDVPTCNVSPP